MTAWLNTKKIIDESAKKPCHKLDYCPYGELVEEFPFTVDLEADDPWKFRCNIFGHDCPVFYHKEKISEDGL